MATNNNLLTKRPFVKILPLTNKVEMTQNPLAMRGESPVLQNWVVIPQEQFLSELYVSGHKINNPLLYPDKIRFLDTDEIKKINGGTGCYVKEKVARYSICLQSIILIKSLASLLGNPLHFTDGNLTPSDEQKLTLQEWQQSWISDNMEENFFQAVKSERSTGDCAMAFWIKGKDYGCKIFSFLNGDHLFPHYDDYGRLSKFVRQYSEMDEEGTTIVTKIEIYDDKYVTTFTKNDAKGANKVADKLKSIIKKLSDNKNEYNYNIDGYTQDGEAVPHGFDAIPVVYHRDMFGACWTPVQDNIDDYEMSMSLLCESNKAYAFPIIVLLGAEANIQGGTDGRPYAITSPDSNAKVDLLTHGDASESFKLQLDTMLKNILMGSFTVIPPEVKSGDLPGVAIKLIYAPSLEKAMADAKEWNPFVDDMVKLYTFARKTAMNKRDYDTISVHGEILPYVHQNTAETVTLICKAVTAGVLSIETALEHNPFSAPDEKSRVLREEVSNELNNTKESLIPNPDNTNIS